MTALVLVSFATIALHAGMKELLQLPSVTRGWGRRLAVPMPNEFCPSRYSIPGIYELPLVELQLMRLIDLAGTFLKGATESAPWVPGT